jgi:hypothetical protein
MKTKPWQWLEAFACQSALMTEWERELGDEFAMGRAYLRPTQRLAESLPCHCGCRHRVIPRAADLFAAVCTCDEPGCKTILARPTDLIVHELNLMKLGDAVRRAFGFDTIPVENRTGPRIQQIGVWSDRRTPVFFGIPGNTDEFLKDVVCLCASSSDSFLLVTPTGRYCDASVHSILQTHNSLHIPMAGMVAMLPSGGLRAIGSAATVLDDFEKRLSKGTGLEKTIARMDRNLEALAKGTYDLRRENEELSHLEKQGFFQFALRVDRDDFQAFAVIMALGNRKAAADFLETPHRSFYDRVEKWTGKGSEYKKMYRMVEWRKASGRKTIAALPDSVLSADSGGDAENPDNLALVLETLRTNQSDNRDYPAILRQILEALTEQGVENWKTIRDEVVELIAEEIPQ